ncbi:hypothetical protein WJX72_008175 [[Myrmecia] bisecta]|uniref:Uncharacterized protein n=1 Tax=[Myrmecia] bisecta TaxID=41462 RepID=A0AAW1Q1I9_9CHLO
MIALRRLDLRWCGSLESLPPGVGGLTALPELDISTSSSLNMLPDSIGRMSLPGGVSLLRSLETLNLRGCCSLGSIPEGIDKLAADWNLTSLQLGDCGRLSVPHEVFDGRLDTKWLDFAGGGKRDIDCWVAVYLCAPAVIMEYALTPASDFPTRDPHNIALQGLLAEDSTGWPSVDSLPQLHWVTLDKRQVRFGQKAKDRVERAFIVEKPRRCHLYRLHITTTQGKGDPSFKENSLQNNACSWLAGT